MPEYIQSIDETKLSKECKDILLEAHSKMESMKERAEALGKRT